MKILDICGKCDERVTNYGTLFAVHLEIPEGRFPTLKENETYLLLIEVSEKKYKRKPKFSLVIQQMRGENRIRFSVAEEKEENFNEEELAQIKEWYKDNKIEKQSEELMKETEELWEALDKKHKEYFCSCNISCTTREEFDEKEKKQKDILTEIEMLEERYGALNSLDKSVLYHAKEKGKTI